MPYPDGFSDAAFDRHMRETPEHETQPAYTAILAKLAEVKALMGALTPDGDKADNAMDSAASLLDEMLDEVKTAVLAEKRAAKSRGMGE